MIKYELLPVIKDIKYGFIQIKDIKSGFLLYLINFIV